MVGCPAVQIQYKEQFPGQRKKLAIQDLSSFDDIFATYYHAEVTLSPWVDRLAYNEPSLRDYTLQSRDRTGFPEDIPGLRGVVRD